MTKLVLRERARGVDRVRYETALGINSITSPALGLIGVLTISSLAIVVSSQLWNLLPLAIAAGLEKNADTWMSIPLADGRSRIIAIDLIIRRLLTVAGFLTLSTAAEVGPVLSISIAECGACLVSAVVARFAVRKSRVASSLERLREIFELARPYWLSGLAVHMRSLDVFLVGIGASVVESGYYAVATRLTGPIQLLPSTLATVLLPRSASATDSDGTARVTRFTTIIFGIACLFGAALVPQATDLLLGEEYLGSVVPIQIVVLGMPFMVYANLLCAVLQGRGHAGLVSRISILYAAVMMPSILVGAVYWGAVGAAIAIASSGIIYAILAHLVQRRTVGST